MIKVGNVWYPRSQHKQAIEAFYWKHKARLTEMRKQRKTRQTKSKEKT